MPPARPEPHRHCLPRGQSRTASASSAARAALLPPARRASHHLCLPQSQPLQGSICHRRAQSLEGSITPPLPPAWPVPHFLGLTRGQSQSRTVSASRTARATPPLPPARPELRGQPCIALPPARPASHRLCLPRVQSLHQTLNLVHALLQQQGGDLEVAGPRLVRMNTKALSHARAPHGTVCSCHCVTYPAPSRDPHCGAGCPHTLVDPREYPWPIRAHITRTLRPCPLSYAP